MKKKISFLLLISFSFIFAQKPEYYSKKSTWYETMIVSSGKLKEYLKLNERRRNLKFSDWYGIGPFITEKENAFDELFEPEKDLDPEKTYESGKMKWILKPEWKDDKVNFFEPVDKSAVYLFRTITSEKDTTITIYLGSDDGIKVWLNKSKVFEHKVDRGCQPGQETVSLKLKKGVNNMFLKINNGGGPTAFCFSLNMANPPELLWKLIEKDFNKTTFSEEITMEKEDKIWDDWENWSIKELGYRYSKSYNLSCEMRGLRSDQNTIEINSIKELQKIREKYHTSRKQEKIILTPKEKPEPKINGPKVFGIRPGHPFLFTIPATGKRPIEFACLNLPPGLNLDKKSGIITGSIKERGEYFVKLIVKNSLGSNERNFKIICGDRIALTPPLGWNSWNCFACDVDDKKVRSAADAMVKSGLINHGWSYINIDDCWEIQPKSTDPLLIGEPRDNNGMINTNKKFPDMKSLSDYIHQKGLKMGIYSSPGKLTCAGYTATYQNEDNDAKRYAEWGIDYLKYDWCSYGQIAKDASLPELKKPYIVMRNALDKVDRDIVYSLCQYGMGKVWEWGAEVGGNSWRTTGDIEDTWKSMTEIGFSQDGHEKFAAPGNWNDPDMLVVGYVGWGPKLHPTRIRPNEQYTHISLWALLSSPLLIGCDMTRLDDFTLNLLTNDEVLEINQDPLGKPAGRIKKDGDIQIWARDLEDGSKAIGIFNLGEKLSDYNLSTDIVGLKGKVIIRDVWMQKDLGVFNNEFKTTIPPHGVVLIKVKSAK